MANEVDRCAADLAWIAAAEPLMSAAYWRANGHECAPPLSLAPARATELAAYLRQLGGRPKVGRYFERVHDLALSATAGLEVLASQLPLRSSGRTVGELDCLYRQHGRVTHREIAIKYYLCVDDSPNPSAWWGPSKRDRLHLKLERMRTHQLCLDALAADAWPTGLPRPDRTEALLVGALFRRPEHRHLPRGANPEIDPGHWFYASEFDPSGWTQLPKPWWLSPEQLRWEPSHAIDAAALRHPVLVARRSAGAVKRAFVVPDGWWEASAN